MKVKEDRHNRLAKDYQYCEEIIKQHSKSFYTAFSRLPKEKATAVFAIYAFCRLADDCVDKGGTKKDKMEALDLLETELQTFENGHYIDQPLWRALRDVFNRYEMNIQPFYDQLTGQRMDVKFVIPETLEHVEEYSYYVAGSVGRILLPILASETNHDLTQVGIDLGVAMQITNILRDIGEDYRYNDRIYLPLSEMAAESYTEIDLLNQTINPAFIRIWEKMALRAEDLYESFEEHVSCFDKDSQLAVLLSSRIYRGILNAVRQNKYNCFSKRNYVSAMEIQRIYRTTKVQNLTDSKK
ncbi:phytoene/squalene synthase family protein [Virgibacillus flavescens]|uniref:phytoene/squalene synthase family protein n=1 Tax=Virgibacillus flavescens TaxID=1611422 RepID=UPI003D325608